jgi:hypothetical protein
MAELHGPGPFQRLPVIRVLTGISPGDRSTLRSFLYCLQLRVTSWRKVIHRLAFILLGFGPRSKGRLPRYGPNLRPMKRRSRIFSQDKQREASVALDRVAMGRSRQHDAVKGNGSPARRNVT